MQPNQLIPNSISRLVLIGFMGAGKSTVGPLLADRLGWKFVDADQHLQSKTGTSIAEIFSKFGEFGFRKMEATAVAELHRQEKTVLALGGGAVESESTRTLLANSRDTCVIFLKAPFELLMERCEQQLAAALRPLLQQRETLTARLTSRLPYYERAHIIVETRGMSPEEVADEIANRLQHHAVPVQLTQKAETT